MRRARLLLLLLAPVAVALVVGFSGAQGAGRPAAALGHQFAAKLSYTETNPGHSQGAATLAIQGRGAFSAKLSAHARLGAAFIALVTGVPVTRIAAGGSFSVQRDIAASGVITGLLVARFKSHGLGTACVSYVEKPGKYVPGSSFVPMSGSFKTVAGTGAAARWRVSVAFKQTSLTGTTVEQFGGSGSEHASVSTARPMTAACKRVAAIR